MARVQFFLLLILLFLFKSISISNAATQLKDMNVRCSVSGINVIDNITVQEFIDLGLFAGLPVSTEKVNDNFYILRLSETDPMTRQHTEVAVGLYVEGDTAYIKRLVINGVDVSNDQFSAFCSNNSLKIYSNKNSDFNSQDKQAQSGDEYLEISITGELEKQGTDFICIKENDGTVYEFPYESDVADIIFATCDFQNPCQIVGVVKDETLIKVVSAKRAQ